MIQKNKKAQSFATKFVFLTVIVLLSAFAIFSLIPKITGSAQETATNEACYQSVIAKSFQTNVNDLIEGEDRNILGILGANFQSPKDADLKCITSLDQINPENEQELLNTIAQEMYQCYDMFGRCEIKNLFGPSGKQYCFLCNIFEINSDIEITPEELNTYLSAHSPKNSDGLTYADIFANCNTPSCSESIVPLTYSPSTILTEPFDFQNKHTIVLMDYESTLGKECGPQFIEYSSEELDYYCGTNGYIYTSLVEEE